MNVRSSVLPLILAPLQGKTVSSWRIDLAISRKSCRFFSTNSNVDPILRRPQLSSQDNISFIAEGKVISSSPGGFAAIKVCEDNYNGGGNSSSLSGDLMGTLIAFPKCNSTGVVIAHRPPVAFVYCDHGIVSIGELACISSTLAMYPVSNNPSTTDCFGRGTTLQESEHERAIFSPIPEVKDIALINAPMLTGITMIDTLAPIGQGQNMLLVSSDGDQLRKYVLDMLRTQHSQTSHSTTLVYASIDSSDYFLEHLKQAGLEGRVHVVQRQRGSTTDEAVHAGAKAAEAVTMAGTACAIGEWFAVREGRNALVVIDTIDAHKELWDFTTGILVDTYGDESILQGDHTGATSSEQRGFFSALIQRAARFKSSHGGGSLTILLLKTIPSSYGSEDVVFREEDFDNSSSKVKDRIKLLLKRNIPLTAKNLQKIEIPVPSAAEKERKLSLHHVDDLHSMTDGMIWLDENMDHEPPVDPQRSVTRIGIGADTESRADAPALRRVAEGLRLTLSQAACAEGGDNTVATQKQVRSQQALLLAMYQKAGAGGRRLSESCVSLLAASRGYLNEAIDKGIRAGSPQGTEIINAMLKHAASTAPAVMISIDDTFDVSDEDISVLLASLDDFFHK